MVVYGSYSGESTEQRDARVRAEEEAERATYAAVTDPRVEAVLNVLAPVRGGDRVPAFEWGHETTPTPAELVEMATEIVAAIERASTRSGR